MSEATARILDAARAYGEAVCFADVAAFEEMCHERFTMTLNDPEGPTYWDKAGYLERVRNRTAAATASYGILSLDVAGDEIARVHCWVDVGDLRYEDHLGFVKQDGRWRLLTKVFRTMGRLDALERG